MKRKKKICSEEQDRQDKPSKFARPDVSTKKNEEKYFDRHVIKCTLAPLCKFSVVKEEIEDTVYWMSRLQIHVHQFMAMYLLESKGVMPGVIDATNLYGFWNKCYRHLSNCLSDTPPKTNTDTQLHTKCKEYIQELNIASIWPSGCFSGWRNKVLDQMAKQSSTIHKTQLDTDMYVYVCRYLNFLIDTKDEYDTIKKLSKKKHKMVVSAILSAFESRIPVTDVVKRRPKTSKELPLQEPVWTLSQTLLQELTSMVPEKCSVSKKSEIAYQILSAVEKHRDDLQAKFLAGDTTYSGSKRKRKWVFSMCPQMTWRPKYIHISTTALKALLQDLSKRHPFMKTLMSDEPEETTWESNYAVWNSLFRMKRVLRGKHSRDHSTLRFGNFISTDGVGVSCVMMKKKSPQKCRLISLRSRISQVDKSDDPGKKDTIKLLRAECKAIEDNMVQKGICQNIKDTLSVSVDQNNAFVTECPVIGLDPGKRNAATWVHHDPVKQKFHAANEHSEEEERYESGFLTGNQWRYLSGQKQYTKKMNKRMELVCPEWKSITSGKTVHTARLLESFRAKERLWPSIKTLFFSSRKWYQKQRMRKFCKKQKAMEDVVAMITKTRNKDEQKRTVVAYGDGDNLGTLKGTSPMMSTTLSRKMKQNCNVSFVNEFKTSLNCSCCHEEMKQKNYRVKWCTNTSCIRSFWNRDINAAINILLLFLQECHNGTRNAKFKRTVLIASAQ